MERYDEVSRSEGWESVVLNKAKATNSLRRYQRGMLLDISRRVTTIEKPRGSMS
jgi:hypothetical protein